MFTKTGILEEFQQTTLPGYLQKTPNVNFNTSQKHFPVIFTIHQFVEEEIGKKSLDLVFTLVRAKI